MIRLNVIVPCYNPPTGWEEALAGRFVAFREALDEASVRVRLVVVNDGSVRNAEAGNFDRLRALLPGCLVVTYPENRGKGYALRQGVAASEADFYLVTDADFPYTIGSMSALSRRLFAEGGIVAGNRDTAYYDSVPLFRKWLSRALRWVLRHVLRQPVDDSQCGLKGFDNAGKAVFLETRIDRFLFDLEFLMLARNRVPVRPAPVTLRDGVVFSKVGFRILAVEGRNFLALLFRSFFHSKRRMP